MVTEREDDMNLTRRQGLAAALGTAAAASLPACAADEPSGKPTKPTGTAQRMPVVFIPHGGGPWPFVDTPFGDRAELDALASYIRALRSVAPTTPRAVLVVSAHWEEPVPTVMTSERPPLYFDYYGFPPEAYRLTWPAPGSPALAARVRQLLETAGFATAEDPARGFDHGAFVPLKLAFPDAEVPTIQLSLKQGLDPADHVAMGRALAPLRDEGVLLVGSGMTFHNMRGFGPAGRAPSITFDAWLSETIALEPAQRDARLNDWASAPAARLAHPREEHLLPLMVVAGAAGLDRGRADFAGTIVGVQLSGYRFA